MKLPDWLSERMIFGLLIIGGFLGCLIVLTVRTLPQANLQLVSQGFGALTTAVGVIVAAIWKTDKADKQNAATLATLVASQQATSSPQQTGPTT